MRSQNKPRWEKVKGDRKRQRDREKERKREREKERKRDSAPKLSFFFCSKYSKFKLEGTMCKASNRIMHVLES
jgi:hypothetical protein